MSASTTVKSKALGELTPELRLDYLQRVCRVRGLCEPALSWRADCHMVSLTPGRPADRHGFYNADHIWLNVSTGEWGYDQDYKRAPYYLDKKVAQFDEQLGDLRLLLADVVLPFESAGVAYELRLGADDKLCVNVETEQENQLAEVVL